jgi:hypothetical protein
MDFKYIKEHYKVPAEIGREIVFSGKKGIISSDKGNYLGIFIYDEKEKGEQVAHPTWEMTYLDSFAKIPKQKNSRGKQRYAEWLHDDGGHTFIQFLANKMYSK